MEAVHSQELSRLVGGLPHDEYLKETGRVQMVEMLFNLIENLDKVERELNEHRSRAADTKRHTDERARTQRDLALAGSPWFDIARKG